MAPVLVLFEMRVLHLLRHRTADLMTYKQCSRLGEIYEFFDGRELTVPIPLMPKIRWVEGSASVLNMCHMEYMCGLGTGFQIAVDYSTHQCLTGRRKCGRCWLFLLVL